MTVFRDVVWGLAKMFANAAFAFALIWILLPVVAVVGVGVAMVVIGGGWGVMIAILAAILLWFALFEEQD